MSLDINPQPNSYSAANQTAEPVYHPSQTVAAPEKSIFNRIMDYALMALVLLVPLIFLPFTSETREFNKQALISLGVLVMAGGWVIKILSNRSVSWNKIKFDYAVLAYLIVALISSIFSMDKASSLLGYYGRFTGSFMSVVAFVLLYFLVAKNVRGEAYVKKLANLLLISTGIILAYSLLQLFGVYILPSFTHSRSFNPIGSLLGLSIFSAVSVVFYQWMMFAEPNASMLKKTALVVLTVLGLFAMFLINAVFGWVVLAIGMVLFLSFGVSLAKSEHSMNWYWGPMLVLVVSILFTVFVWLPTVNPRKMVTSQIPQEIQLSNSTNFNLVKNSMASGGKQAVIGSGPGTMGLAFGQIKPVELNKTIVWSLNFDRASTEIANIAIETGILGVLAFEGMAILFLFYAVRFLLKRDGPGKMAAFGFFLMFATLYAAHFVTYFNTTFYFLYWLSMALFFAVTVSANATESASQSSFNASPKSALVWMFGSLLMLALILVGVFFQSTVYAAEMAYTGGIKTLNQTNPDFTKARADFARAVSLNQYRDVYFLAYAQDLLYLTSIEAAKKDANIPNIQTWISQMVAAARAATIVSPNKASNWSSLAQFYGSLKPLSVKGTDDLAIESWKAAIKLDSRTPSLYAQLAQAYVDSASVIDPAILGTGTDTDKDGLSDEMEATIGSDPNKADSNGDGVNDGDTVKAGLNPVGTGSLSTALLSRYTKVDNSKLKQAEDALSQAIALKADLPELYIALARIQEKEGKLADAKKTLDDAAAKFPNNMNVLYEQGRITFNQGDYAKSEVIFDNVLKLSPKNANALYSLALLDLKKGDKQKALDGFKQVREISGPNVDLDKLINQLQTELNK